MSDAKQQSSDFINNLYGNAYDMDQNRRLQAAGALEQMRCNAANMRMGAENQWNTNLLNRANFVDQNAINQGNIASALATNESNAINAAANAIRPVNLTNSSSSSS